MTYIALLPSAVPEYTRRIKFLDQISNRLAQLVSSALDDELVTVWNYVKPRISSRLVDASSNLCFFTPLFDDQSQAILVAAISAADGWTMPPESPARLFSIPSAGSPYFGAYYRSTKTIYLPMDWDLSETLLAITFFHELVHAYDHQNFGTNSQLYELQTEKHARRLEYRLLQMHYGSKVDQLVALVREHLTSLEVLSGDLDAVRWQPDDSVLPTHLMVDVFGVPQSYAERDLLRQLIGRAARAS